MALITKKKIVILGGGFGGIKAAFFLCKKIKKLGLEEKYEVILIDKNSFHTYTPILYEIAATSEEIADQSQLKEIATFDLKSVFSGYRITVLQDLVKELDLAGGDIHLEKNGVFKFDYLMLAIGSEINYFGIAGLKENSLSLKSFHDALEIRNAVWDKVKNNNSKKEIKIVIGGGGSTGVEVAGEMRSWICEPGEKSPECPASVTIVEAYPSLLFGFDQKIIKAVTRRLKAIGVKLLLNEAIEKAEPGKIILKSGRLLDYDILIWTGGVKTASLMGTLPLKKETKGRVEVAGEMECLPQSPDLKLYGKIYGLGDAICLYNPKTGRPMPMVAEAAIEQAGVAAFNIIEDIKFNEGLSKKIRNKKYVPREYSYVITAGGKYAAVKIGPLVFWGFSGWILKVMVELYYLIRRLLPPGKAIRVWLKGLRIFMRNDGLG